MDSLTVQPIASEHIKQVIQLQLRIFPENRASKMGRFYLKALFWWYISHDSAFVFVASLGDQVVGYGSAIQVPYFLPQLKALWLQAIIRWITRPWKLRGRWIRHAIWKRIRSLWTGKMEMSNTRDRAIEAPYFYLLSIAVVENMRKQGVGEQLLAAIEAEVERLGNGGILVTVGEANIAACHLYEKRGWIKRINLERAESVNYWREGHAGEVR